MSPQPKYPAFGQVQHVDGSLWNVRDARTTKHDFDLHFGNPVTGVGALRAGLPQLIDTQALYDFWDLNRLKGHGFLFSLPAGRTTLKRSRKRMGFNHRNDTDDFWLSHTEDLDRLPIRQFALKHNVSFDLAMDWRRKILGTRARPIGWWRTPETYAVLLANVTLREKAAKLGVQTSQVFRLKTRALVEPLFDHNSCLPG